MSSSKSLFEDVKWALSNRKLGPFKMALKKSRKLHKYAILDRVFLIVRHFYILQKKYKNQLKLA